MKGAGQPTSSTGSVGLGARRPDWSQHKPDARLDPYRQHVGRLYRNGKEIGLLSVRVDVRATAASGTGVWPKWSPTYDSLSEWVIFDGNVSDHVGGRESVDQALQDYAARRFKLSDKTLRVDWTTPDESHGLRQMAFGSTTRYRCRSSCTWRSCPSGGRSDLQNCSRLRSLAAVTGMFGTARTLLDRCRASGLGGIRRDSCRAPVAPLPIPEQAQPLATVRISL